MLRFTRLLNFAFLWFKKNADSRELAGQPTAPLESVLEELDKIARVLPDIEKNQLKCFGHVVRANNLHAAILHGRITGTRIRSIPRRRRLDDIKEWTRLSILSASELHRTGRSKRSQISCPWPSTLAMSLNYCTVLYCTTVGQYEVTQQVHLLLSSSSWLRLNQQSLSSVKLECDARGWSNSLTLYSRGLVQQLRL